MSDVGIALFAIGWLGAAISMAVHIVGVFAGWWGTVRNDMDNSNGVYCRVSTREYHRQRVAQNALSLYANIAV